MINTPANQYIHTRSLTSGSTPKSAAITRTRSCLKGIRRGRLGKVRFMPDNVSYNHRLACYIGHFVSWRSSTLPRFIPDPDGNIRSPGVPAAWCSSISPRKSPSTLFSRVVDKYGVRPFIAASQALVFAGFVLLPCPRHFPAGSTRASRSRLSWFPAAAACSNCSEPDCQRCADR